MITPRFNLTQDDKFLIIQIRAPYCNLKELEIYIELNDFRFICAPYYLRLTLPGNIIENDSAKGEFSSDTGEFTFKYCKETAGEFFEGLDFITSLLNPSKPKKSRKTVGLIEVVASETNEEDNDVVNDSETNADGNSGGGVVKQKTDGSEWSVEQKVPEILQDNGIKLLKCSYGFGNQKCGFLEEIQDEFTGVFDIKNVEKMSPNERKLLRVDTEAMHFSQDHYLADYFEHEMIQELINTENPWQKMEKSKTKFSPEELDVLKDLPNKEYLLNTEESHEVFTSLIDILFAYCYDKRTTDFESTSESCWTVSKISATLSWFDTHSTEKEAVISGFRRSLIYPLYRNFSLATTVLNDLKLLLNLGQIFIIKSLIDIYNMFNSSCEPRYILNELYIKDYIIYMQKCSKEKLKSVIAKVEDIQIVHNDVNLNLTQIIREIITYDGNPNVLSKMSNLNIRDDDSSDSETDSSDSESSSDESSSEEETDSDEEVKV